MDIIVIGSGGVAESLVFSLIQAGVAPRVIVSPTLGHAERLRDLYAPECTILHDLAEMPRNADIYLLAVTDTAIASCAAQMPSTSGVWLHTAACVPVETLTQYHPDSGIFYPLNTFSKGRPLSWQGMPLFVEHRSEITAVGKPIAHGASPFYPYAPPRDPCCSRLCLQLCQSPMGHCFGIT